MLEKLRIIFTIPELRRKIFLTLALLAIYRVGYQIPLPIVDTSKAASLSESGGIGDLLEQATLFSGSRLNQMTIFGLGIMPYISASIIFQLLASVWSPLEQLQKEGESGRKKINEYTRYATVVLCLLQSWLYLKTLAGMGMIRDSESFVGSDGSLTMGWTLLAVLTMTAGSTFLMWLGEQIDEYGIGNGISLLIMANILARMPEAGWDLIKPMVKSRSLELSGGGNEIGIDGLVLLLVLFVAVVVGVVFITQGQRRIRTQSAKFVRGRRVYGGGQQYLPLRVNQSGVMPIIFASSLLLFPQVLFQALDRWAAGRWELAQQWFAFATDIFQRGDSFVYNALYVLLIYFFCYFWSAITFNPKDMADNLKTHGTFIPGYRPGRRTADYLEKVMLRITYVGAGFLALVAIAPTLVSTWMGVPGNTASFYGGTGLLIAVSVAFDLVQKIDSHLVMRNYKGLLE
jgi:preprotein translocase subunit SecY